MPICQESTGLAYLRQLVARRDDIAVYPPDALDHDEPPKDVYFYRPGELLVSGDPGQMELFQDVAAKLELCYSHYRDDEGEDAEEADTDGGATRFFIQSGSELETVLGQLDESSAGELRVSPNHLIFGLAPRPIWGLSPGDEPALPPAGPLPQPRSPKDGAGVVVAVIDSGLPQYFERNELLRPVKTHLRDLEPRPYEGPTPLTFPQGHGSFVAGTVRLAAGGATVKSYRVLDTDGVTDEWFLGRKVKIALAEDPAVINLSLGAKTRQDETLLGLAPLAAAASQEGGPIVVAAAGNLHSDRPFYPAADPWTISVGAVELTGLPPAPRRASFSDFGPWVDVCANGVKLTSAFEAHPYQPLSNGAVPVPFNGFAQWSGTSFATAHVSGVVATHLALQGALTRDQVLTHLSQSALSIADLGHYVP